MRVFTVNQVNQVYVVNSVTSSTPAAKGAVRVGSLDDSIWVQHYGPAGITRSDLIDKKNILWTKVTPASAMRTYLKEHTVTLASAALDNGAPIVGQDYILRVVFNNYIGVSVEDSQYWKYGVVHVSNGMSASDFYKALAISLRNNMLREPVELVKIKLGVTGSDPVEVTKSTNADSLTGTYASLILGEVEPEWMLGLKQEKVLDFEVVPTDIDIVEGTVVTPVKWGEVAVANGTVINNGKLAAEYEYFFHGERGDQFRMSGWPDYVHTDYLADPNVSYDFVQIHFAYVGPNEGCQKSEKDVTFLCLPWVTADLVTALNGVLPSGVAIDDSAIEDNPTSPTPEAYSNLNRFDVNADGEVNVGDLSTMYKAILAGGTVTTATQAKALFDSAASLPYEDAVEIQNYVKDWADEQEMDTSEWEVVEETDTP